jgi:hypothetical protein
MEPHFYILEQPRFGSSQDRAHGTEALHEEGFKTGPAPRCSGCERYVGLLKWLPPFRVELETWGREFGDVMRFSEELLVSERFKEIYTGTGLKGLLDFEPVEVVSIKKHRKLIGEPPRYFKAEVIRSETTVDRLASGAEWEGTNTICPVCLLGTGTFLRQKRVVIEPGTWTGHDIFHARGGTNFVASERMRGICETNQIKNARWIPADEFEVDFYPSIAKQVRRYLRDWEDQDQDSAARQDAYRTLVFYVDRTRERIPKGPFNPDHDIDPSVIAAAKSLAAVNE